jgi:hypothetical protein
VLVAAAAVVVALTALGGSSSPKASTSAGRTRTTSGSHTSARHHGTSRTGSTSRAANPAEASVAVLNGTETTGLAHRISGQLQQRGYSQSTALSGRPQGTSQETLVEYAAGHRADAEGVAHSLAVSRVQPMEAAVASLGGSAKVVVIVGADKAAAGP